MTEPNEHKKSYIENLLDDIGKVGDALPAVGKVAARFGLSHVAEGLHVADGVLGVFLGPLLAVYDAANPENDPLIRAVSLLQIPASLAAKYGETARGILIHSGVEVGMAAEAGAANITLGSFITSPGLSALVIGEFKVVYAGTRWLDENYLHWSDAISDWAVGSKSIDPIDYPKTTIYHYLESNLPMPEGVREKVEQGLKDQGATWPQFGEYPLYIQQELNERAMNGLESMINTVRAAAGEMESWVFIDPDAGASEGTHASEPNEPDRRVVPQAGAGSESVGGHHQSAPDRHAQAPDGGNGLTRTPIGYIEVLTAGGLERVPYYDAPQGAEGTDHDPSSRPEPVPVPADVPHTVPYEPPAPAPQTDMPTDPGAFAPAADELGVDPGAFAPAADELGVDPGAFAPAADELGVDPGAFAPAADELGVDPGAFAPAADELGVDPGAFAPAADELGVDPGAFAPAADELGVDPGAFAPAADELGVDPGAFAPAADEEIPPDEVPY